LLASFCLFGLFLDSLDNFLLDLIVVLRAEVLIEEVLIPFLLVLIDIDDGFFFLFFLAGGWSFLSFFAHSLLFSTVA
jgi:hypothetical protein